MNVWKPAAAAALAMAFALPAMATPPPYLNWGKRISNDDCAPDANGPPVINIKRQVLNSLDSGFGSDIWWAMEDYRQSLTVFRVGADTFCLLSSFQGRFNGLAGYDSPADNGPMSGDESGPFQGGYHAVVEGELKPRGEFGMPARGFAGTFDFECDAQASQGTFPPVCPGHPDFLGQYFEPGYSLQYQWWGWIYRGGRAGTFVNSSDGSDGDILLQ